MVTDTGGSGSTRAADGDASDRYERHLARSRRVWNRWSDRYGRDEKDLEPMREAAMDRLDLRRGDRVLEVGCGPGVNFERLREEVGADGSIVAVEYSPDMAEKARERIAAHGWENVEVRRADATTAEFDDEFDAALATLSMSVMPDVRRTTENVHRSLAPGAPFVVFDVRPFQRGPARVLNPIVWRLLRWYANWNPDGDVEESLAAVFEECEVVDTYWAGSSFTARCEKRPDSRG